MLSCSRELLVGWLWLDMDVSILWFLSSGLFGVEGVLKQSHGTHVLRSV